MREPQRECQSLRFDNALPCDNCGRYGAFAFDGKNLCGDCYELHGSCCPEFGGDDLWQAREPKPSEVDPNGPK